MRLVSHVLTTTTTGMAKLEVLDKNGLHALWERINGAVSLLLDMLSGKADSVHTHTIGDVDNLQSSLNSLQSGVNGKADKSHTHSSISSGSNSVSVTDDGVSLLGVNFGFADIKAINSLFPAEFIFDVHFDGFLWNPMELHVSSGSMTFSKLYVSETQNLNISIWLPDRQEIAHNAYNGNRFDVQSHEWFMRTFQYIVVINDTGKPLTINLLCEDSLIYIKRGVTSIVAQPGVNVEFAAILTFDKNIGEYVYRITYSDYTK